MPEELLNYLDKVGELVKLDINNLSMSPEQLKAELNKLDYAISKLLPKEPTHKAAPAYDEATIKEALELLGVDEVSLKIGKD